MPYRDVSPDPTGLTTDIDTCVDNVLCKIHREATKLKVSDRSKRTKYSDRDMINKIW